MSGHRVARGSERKQDGGRAVRGNRIGWRGHYGREQRYRLDIFSRGGGAIQPSADGCNAMGLAPCYGRRTGRRGGDRLDSLRKGVFKGEESQTFPIVAQSILGVARLNRGKNHFEEVGISTTNERETSFPTGPAVLGRSRGSGISHKSGCSAG